MAQEKGENLAGLQVVEGDARQAIIGNTEGRTRRMNQCPCGPGRIEPFEANSGETVHEHLGKALLDCRRAAWIADQKREPMPARAGRTIAFEGQRLAHHLPDIFLRRGRESAHSDGRRDGFVRARIQKISELSFHPARGSVQRGHNLRVGSFQGAHQQNVVWSLVLTTELVDMLLEQVSVAGANLLGVENIRRLDQMHLHTLGPAMVAQGRQGVSKRGRGHDDPLLGLLVLGARGQRGAQDDEENSQIATCHNPASLAGTHTIGEPEWNKSPSRVSFLLYYSIGIALCDKEISMKSVYCLIVGLLIATPGCGQGDRARGPAADAKVAMQDALPAKVMAPGQAADKPAIARKIKFTADIRMITVDFDKSKTDLLNLLEKNKGYVAQSDLSISPGSPKSGVWRLRIPERVFNPFCDEVQKIGQVEKFSTNSEDVTEDFYDTERHIESRQSFRLELLKNSKENINRIGEVDTEIDRLQGRLKVLTNLTDLTTITITIHEQQKFNPDRPPEAVEKPDFTTAAGKAFGDSYDALKSFGVSATLLLISVSPWLALIFVLALPIWLINRLAHRRRKIADNSSEKK